MFSYLALPSSTLNYSIPMAHPTAIASHSKKKIMHMRENQDETMNLLEKWEANVSISKIDLPRLLSSTFPNSATTPRTSSISVGSEASIFGLVLSWHKMPAAVFSCSNIFFWSDALSSFWVSEPSLFSIPGVLERWYFPKTTVRKFM